MNGGRLERFKKQLDDLGISDYYGLQSPGLTCYLNSVLQVLFMTSDFREAVKRCGGDGPASFDSHLAKLFCALESGLARTHEAVRSLGITDVYEQRDAAEYLERILCLTNPEASQIFRGELNHRTTCLRCGDTGDSRSPFWTLPLPMEGSPRGAFDVELGLKAFFQVQRVHGADQMFCTECHAKQDADTEWEVTRCPGVLTLLLKRFDFDRERRRYVKLRCPATLPRTLRLKDHKYRLYAVVNHSGDLAWGHYTADIRSFETSWWYCFNDGAVGRARSEYSEACVLRSCSAYLLMYRKESKQSAGSDVEARSARPCGGGDGGRRGGDAERAEAPPLCEPEDEDQRGQEGRRRTRGSSPTRRYDSAERTASSARRRGDTLPSILTDGRKSDADVRERRPQEGGGCNGLRHKHVNNRKAVATTLTGGSVGGEKTVRKRGDETIKKPWKG